MIRASVEALASALEASAPPESSDVDAVAEAVRRRAPLLAALDELDPGTLGEAERARLREALERAMRADARVAAHLDRQRRAAAEALDGLVDARGAVRGYRGLAPHAAGAVLREA